WHQLELHSFPTRRSSDLDLLEDVYFKKMAKFHHSEEDDAKKSAQLKSSLIMQKTISELLALQRPLIEKFLELYLKKAARHERMRSEEHTSELQSRENLVC